jgi:hypothetical protein
MTQMGFFVLPDHHASPNANSYLLVDIDAGVSWVKFRPKLAWNWCRTDVEQKRGEKDKLKF